MKNKKDKPHFHVTAGLIWQNERLLITKRPEGSHLAGLWEFPGGKQEDGETLEQCLKREIMEELGIEVQIGKRLLTVDHEYERRMISLHLYQCIHLSGEPEPLECDDLKWVHPTDLTKYRFPPPDRRIIRLLKRWKEP